MREHGVKSAVVEERYVCLDYRSEQAAFYSKLNAPVQHSSPRLHFFTKALASDGTLIFDDELAASYRGYVVCRPGHLPLVGRSVIQTPEYVHECSDIEEVVHLLGSTLTVRGVPFMQQDERFVVCAQVAAWITHYSYFRRGLGERRLIADFAVEGDTSPMRPQSTSALLPSHISDRLSRFGLRTVSYMTPLSETYDYPVVPVALITDCASRVERIVAQIRALWGERDEGQADEGQGDHPAFVELLARASSAQDDISNFADYVYPIAYELQSKGEEEVMGEVEKLQTEIFDLVTRPFIRSRWPIYCQTRDHAMVLCGRSETDTDVIHFYHDDQYGPYLASSDGIAVSKDAFAHQSYVTRDPHPQAPKEDLARAVVDGSGESFTDRGREIYQILVPQPARSLLDPSAALNSTLWLVEDALEGSPTRWTYNSVAVMGLDYKNDRLRQVGARDGRAAEFFASCSLAEWVVVVEAKDALGHVVWECVYDGTSGSNYPELQLLRFGRDLLQFEYGHSGLVRRQRFRIAKFVGITVPPKVGKAS
ncbi:MAG: hypothetical protein IPH03_09735 [Tetrasphaera sp.]|nr:hypothetical protein [Tetrasphaera sp.]